MKNIILVFATLLLISSCKKETESNDYVTFSGKITNATEDALNIIGPQYKKLISVDKNGIFIDTLKVKEGFYMLRNGELQTFLHLKNGYDLQIDFDVKNFKNSLSFSGLGAGTNNYMAEKTRYEEREGLANYNSFFELEKQNFDAKIKSLKSSMASLIDNAVDLDSTFLARELKSNDQFIQFLTSNYQRQHNILVLLGKGKPSPKFNYPDINGKNVSLDDLKGKYVYIDVWATWCGPCKREIPFLKEIEENYKDKNIAFVGLSIDTQENKEKWKNMVGERGLKGYQILADNDWKSQFVEDYKITGIPRFILIDPDGNIVSHDAPRPSNPALKELFNELKI